MFAIACNSVKTSKHELICSDCRTTLSRYYFAHRDYPECKYLFKVKDKNVSLTNFGLVLHFIKKLVICVALQI